MSIISTLTVLALNIDKTLLISKFYKCLRVNLLGIFVFYRLVDLIIGGGRIEMGIPFIDKNIVLNEKDLTELKSILTSKE